MFRESSRDRFLIRVSEEDQPYRDRVRDILLGEPCRGVPVEASQLSSHLYIGSQTNAESLRGLRRLGVTHVLNCAGFRGPRTQPDMSPYEGLGIEYHEFKAEDVDTYDIVQHFRESFSFIDRAHRRGGVVLVHCAMGINRSAATCVAYLMHHKNWNLLKCLQFIKDKRRVVLTNKGFQLQLIRYARSSGMLEKLETAPKARQSRSRDLPPRYRDFNDHLPPRPRREVCNVLNNSYHVPSRQPIMTSFNPINHRRNSTDFRRIRRECDTDVLGMCIQEALSLGRRSNSLDRCKNTTRF